MTKIQHITIEILCPKCHKKHILNTNGKDSIRKTITCECGAIFTITMQIRIKDYTEFIEMLPEFIDWLCDEKKLTRDTAKTYARCIERWIREGVFPRYTAPFDHFREFLVKKKGWHPMLARYALD